MGCRRLVVAGALALPVALSALPAPAQLNHARAPVQRIAQPELTWRHTARLDEKFDLGAAATLPLLTGAAQSAQPGLIYLTEEPQTSGELVVDALLGWPAATTTIAVRTEATILKSDEAGLERHAPAAAVLARTFEPGEVVGSAELFDASATAAAYSFATGRVPLLGESCFIGLRIDGVTGPRYGWMELRWLDAPDEGVARYMPVRWSVSDAAHQPIPVIAAPACPADVTRSGVVGAADLSRLLSAWGETGVNEADINRDGVVDAADLSLVLSSWGACE